LVFAAVSVPAPARADHRPVPPARDRQRAEDELDFRLRFVLPMWLPLLAMDSSAETEGGGSDVVETQAEVKWVIMGRLEAGYHPIIARADVFGIGLGEQFVRRNGELTDASVEASGVIGRAILMYEFGPWRLRKHSPRHRFLFAPLAGGRYNRVALEASEQTELSGAYDWIDLLVGLRTEFLLGNWRLGTHVDVGGFGVSSELAFWASANVEYMIASWFSIWIGWQHYQVLFEKSSDRGEHKLELFLTGPSAGIGFHVF
ncbi:MAG TPA: hypothetical protein VGK73_22415, partial [Polyangiaceae bacterium]